MNKLISFIIFLITILSLTLNFFFYKTFREENRVIEVVDGDTFQLKSGKRVRLLGVDAPEYDRCGGQEAKERLQLLIKNKIVDLKEEQQETYGRSLALTYQNGRLINEIVLKEGWARTDYRKNSQREKLTAAYHFAKNNNIGIYSTLCREPANSLNSPNSQNCQIKGNIDKSTYQKFYHLPSCKQYNQIVIDKDMGEGYFCSEKEAEAAGFKKASGCP